MGFKDISSILLHFGVENNKGWDCGSSRFKTQVLTRAAIVLFLFFCRSLALAADFDCAVVGTSPIPLFEALYRHASGERVLILEAATECGGAWKSIDICGIEHVDMGCHEISSTPELNQFLKTYAGCTIRAIGNRSYYFSEGCFELIDHLLKRINEAGIPLLTQCKVESATLDFSTCTASLHTAKGTFTATKIIVTPGSSFPIFPTPPHTTSPHKFYHLYLLLQDPTPPRFFYHGNSLTGVSRIMNLTPCVGLEHTGRQLIVLQTHSDAYFQKQEWLLEELKRIKLVDPNAYLLTSDTYIYEQGPRFQIGLLSPNQQAFFEMLNTSHFNRILNYIPKWKTILKPYEELKINNN